jgi:hypothetical protein
MESAMWRLSLFLAFLILGGIFFKYFAQDVRAFRYESKTAKLIEEIDNLPPTAAGRK